MLDDENSDPLTGAFIAEINCAQIAVRISYGTPPPLKARLMITRRVFGSMLSTAAEDSTTQQVIRLAFLLNDSAEEKV